MSEADIDSVPKSLVLKRTSLSVDLRLFEGELRGMMAPFTSLNLKESTKLKMREITSAASNFGAKNLILLSEKDDRSYLRFAQSSKGPTFTFKIENFSLERDMLKVHGGKSAGLANLGAPFVNISGMEDFKDNRAGKMLHSLFSNLFPDEDYLRKNKPRRVVSFSYDQSTDQFEVRNYLIERQVAGVSDAVQKILKGAQFDFSQFNDAGQLFLGEEEIEDRGEGKETKRKVRLMLHEVGPRFTLKLIKIEEGLMNGEVLFHSLFSKSSEEVEALRSKIQERERKRAENRRIQEENVKRKEDEKEEKYRAKQEKHRLKAQQREAEKQEKEGSDNDQEEDSEQDEEEKLPSKPILRSGKRVKTN